MIDSHCHAWTMDPARYPWHQTLAHVPIPARPATAEDLIAAMELAGVERAVLVQPSVYGYDNAYLFDSMTSHPGRFAGVSLVDPRRSDGPDRVRDEYDHGARGVRLKSHR